MPAHHRVSAPRLWRFSIIGHLLCANSLYPISFVGIIVGINTIISLFSFIFSFLDKKNRLIADEVQQTGTIDHTPVYPREVMRRALELSASALILVHNHPSGDPAPSRADIDMTRTIVETGRPLGVVIHDHVIIGRQGHASLKGLQLM